MQGHKSCTAIHFGLPGYRAWRVFLFLTLLTGHVQVQGQQMPQFTQFTALRHYVNPAASGTDGLRAGFAGRHQWTGLVNQSGTSALFHSYLAFADMSLNNNGNGTGLLFMADRADLETTYLFRLNGAHHISTGKKLTFSMGLSVDLMNKTLDFTPSEGQGSPAILPFTGRQGASGVDLGAGFMLSHQQGHYVAISSHNLLESTLKYSGFNYRNVRQYQIMAGARIPFIDSRSTSLIYYPSVLVHSTQSMSPQITVQGLFLVNERFRFGMAYRYEDAVAFILGWDFGSFNMGLSYDYTTSALRDAGSHGSPELTITWKKPDAIKSRWDSRWNNR